MKTKTKLTGMILLILLTFSVTLNAQRGQRGYGFFSDSLRITSMRSQMAPGRMAQRGNLKNQKQMYGMRYNMESRPRQIAMAGRGAGNIDQRGRGPMASQRLIAESVPNVTEKQKQDIADLRLKQQEEMKKLRDESFTKIQSLRDNHNKAFLNILTDEQKKFIESKQVKPVATPAPVK